MAHTEVLSLRSKITLAFVSTVGLAVGGFWLYTHQHNRESDNNRLMAHTYAVIDQMQQVQALLLDVETGARGYVATGDSLFLAPYRQALPHLTSALTALGRSVADNPLQQRRVNELRAAVAAKVALSTQQVSLIRAGGSPAQLRPALVAGNQRMDGVRRQIADMVATEQHRLAERRMAGNAAYVTTNRLIALLTLLAAVVMALAFVLLNRELVRRGEAEQTARQQAQTIQSIFDMSMVDISAYTAIRDPSGEVTDYRIDFMNRHALAEMDLLAGDVIGRTLLTVFPQMGLATATNTGGSVLDLRKQVLTTGQSVRYEMALSRPDGEEQWYLLETAKNGDGLLVTGLNITDRKRAEQQAQNQAGLLQSVLDGSPNAIVAFDAVRNADGRITDFRYVLQNEVNRRRVDRADAVLLGRTMLEFFPDIATNGLLEQYRQVVETGETLRFETEFTYNHTTGWYGYSVIKRGDGIVLTVADKTAEHQAQRIIEQATHELRRSNENLQSFAFVASHDLQEPLRKIRAFGDLVLNDYGPLLPDEGTDMLRRIQSAAERMQTLIHDLLTLSRLSTKQQPFVRVDLGEVLTGVLSDLETTITDTGAVIDVPPLPIVTGDALQLRQAFQNLLSNALKFQKTRHASRVNVATGKELADDATPESVPHVRITCVATSVSQLPVGLLSSARTRDSKPSFTYYALTVTDNGIGFDAGKYGEQIFGAFQRLQGRSSPYSGTGIGLAIVKKVAETHGGAVTVSSREGEGAAFTLYLPAASTQPTVSAEALA